MSDDTIRIKTRVKYQGVWMPWRELANDYSIINALEKKAPNGFGLGSDPSPFSDANDCIIKMLVDKQKMLLGIIHIFL